MPSLGAVPFLLEGLKVRLPLDDQQTQILDFAGRHDVSTAPIRSLALRWTRPMPFDGLYLGEAWERGYGHMGFQTMRANRFMPRYFLAVGQEQTEGYGVVTGADAFCFWQDHRRLENYNAGPWRRGNKKFGDLANLADRIKAMGIEPGIWYRPLLNEDETIADQFRLPHNGYLDPSAPQALDYIRQDIAQLGERSYQLVKQLYRAIFEQAIWASASCRSTGPATTPAACSGSGPGRSGLTLWPSACPKKGVSMPPTPTARAYPTHSTGSSAVSGWTSWR